MSCKICKGKISVEYYKKETKQFDWRFSVTAHHFMFE